MLKRFQGVDRQRELKFLMNFFDRSNDRPKDVVFASPVQSGFLPPKRATVDRNRSRTDPDVAGTEPDHLGPVFCVPWN